MYKVLRVKGRLLLAAVLAFCMAAAAGAAGEETLCTNAVLEQAVLPAQAAETGGRKVAYLTFDDGPSKTTEQVLDILAEYDVKATFFVCAAENNEKYLPILARTVAEGHQIGLHSATHEYKKIYASPEAYWQDLDLLWEKISPYVPQRPTCIRFPGGSTNTVSRKYGGSDIMRVLKGQATEKGLRYFDWNNCAGDAVGGKPSSARLVENVRGEANGDHLIVLMHDTNATRNTAEALPQIITLLAEKGYVFDVVENYPRPEEMGSELT